MIGYVFPKDGKPDMAAIGEAAEKMKPQVAVLDRAVGPTGHLVGDGVTLADICFVAELSLFSNERTRVSELARSGLEPILHGRLDEEFPRAMAHFDKLRRHPGFAPDVEPYLAKIDGIVVRSAAGERT